MDMKYAEEIANMKDHDPTQGRVTSQIRQVPVGSGAKPWLNRRTLMLSYNFPCDVYL